MSDAIAMWRGSGIPRRLLAYGFDELSDTDECGPQKRAVWSWVYDLPARQAEDENGVPQDRDGYGRGLLLTGPPGTGKTTVACAALTAVRKSFGRSIYFTTFPDYLQARQKIGAASFASMSQDDARALVTVVNSVSDSFLVVLDDVGHEYSPGSGYGERLLAEILRRRYNFGTPTIITTNLGAKAWGDRYDAALRSFIHQACPPIEFPAGIDYRLRNAHAG